MGGLCGKKAFVGGLNGVGFRLSFSAVAKKTVMISW